MMNLINIKNAISRWLTGLVFVSCFLDVYAQHLSKDEAAKRACLVLKEQLGRKDVNPNIFSHVEELVRDGIVYGYAYGLENGGWMAITAEQQIEPLLAYCESGRFPTQEEMSPALAMMFDWYGEQVYAILHERSKPLGFNSHAELSAASSTTIEPLLGSLYWNQSGSNSYTLGANCPGNVYNKFCPPAEEGPDNKAYAGCVAVAMAQIMHYWKWPHTAYISNSISTSGRPSNDKHWVEYDWCLMPSSISQCSTPESEVDMIAGLLRDCGYMAKMEYSASGSSASESDARDAFVDVFSYKSTASRKLKTSYTNVNWKNMILSELVNGRPVMYSGFQPMSIDSGHEFVVDGYQASTGTFHINWGWGGDCNGWYTLTDLRSDHCGSLDSTNYTNFNFTWAFSAIIGIEPNIRCDNYVGQGSVGRGYYVATSAGVIETANTFQSGGIGLLYSGSQIRLTTGFHAGSGSYIHAVIRDIDCTTPLFAPPTPNTKDEVGDSRGDKLELIITPTIANDIVRISGYDTSYTIYNAMGQFILTSYDNMISVSGWNTGMYIVRAGTQTRKFLVK